MQWVTASDLFSNGTIFYFFKMRTYDTIFDLITISTKFEKLCTYLFLTSKVSRSQPKSMVLMVRISSDAHFDSTNKTNDHCTGHWHNPMCRWYRNGKFSTRDTIESYLRSFVACANDLIQFQVFYIFTPRSQTMQNLDDICEIVNCRKWWSQRF